MGILNEYRIIAQVIWNDWWRRKKGDIFIQQYFFYNRIISVETGLVIVHFQFVDEERTLRKKI